MALCSLFSARDGRSSDLSSSSTDSEARQVVAQCAEGTARGDECANAEQAVIEAEGRERFKKFMGN